MKRNGWILRISPGGIDRTDEALKSNTIIIGWAQIGRIMEGSLNYYEYRRIIKDEYYPDDENLRRAGSAAGNMWRFVQEMNEGDYVVVPVAGGIHIAEVTGPAFHMLEKVDEDTAFRRNVKWHTRAEDPIRRDRLVSGLHSRTKIRGTSASASEYVDEISKLIAEYRAGKVLTFEDGLSSDLKNVTLEKLREGRMQHSQFERFLAELGSGCIDCCCSA